MTPNTLVQENRYFHNTGGISQNNADIGFRAAFRDELTGNVFLSRFANGKVAPIHLLNGLPDDLVETREQDGRVVRAKKTLTSGFERLGAFFTRDEAAAACIA